MTTDEPSKEAKESVKILHRWLARHYDKSAEQAVFNLEKALSAARDAGRNEGLEEAAKLATAVPHDDAKFNDNLKFLAHAIRALKTSKGE